MGGQIFFTYFIHLASTFTPRWPLAGSRVTAIPCRTAQGVALRLVRLSDGGGPVIIEWWVSFFLAAEASGRYTWGVKPDSLPQSLREADVQREHLGTKMVPNRLLLRSR